jgi:plasmid maintenance system killer protein
VSNYLRGKGRRAGADLRQFADFFWVKKNDTDGQWSMVNGQWSMVNGQWSMVNKI